MEDNYNQYYDSRNPFEPKKRRPGIILVLAILTFIGSGFNLLSNAVWIFMGKSMANFQMPFQNEQMLETIHVMSEAAAWKYVIIALFYLVSIIGAVFMLYMKKLGFHVYTASQIILLFLPSFLIFNQIRSDMFSVLFTVLFIVLYGVHYKNMTWELNDIEPNSDLNDTNSDEQ